MKTIKMLALATILLSACQSEKASKTDSSNTQRDYPRALNGYKGKVKTYASKSYEYPLKKDENNKIIHKNNDMEFFFKYAKNGHHLLQKFILVDDNYKNSIKESITNEVNKDDNILLAHYYEYIDWNYKNEELTDDTERGEKELVYTCKYEFKKDSIIKTQTNKDNEIESVEHYVLDENGRAKVSTQKSFWPNQETIMHAIQTKWYNDNGLIDSITIINKLEDTEEKSYFVYEDFDDHGNPTKYLHIVNNKDTILNIDSYTYYN